MNRFNRLLFSVCLVCLVGLPSRADDAVGSTSIARWNEDRAAAFQMMFDDSCPSHWQVAIPEMVRRGLMGTFYLNCGKAEYTKFRGGWETNYWKQGMVYANHTMTHKGVKNMDEAEREIGDCARIIRDINPSSAGKLQSYGQPGVGPGQWEISKEQLDGLLKRHNLITRGEIAGHMAVYHLKTTAELLAMADRAISNRSAEFIVFHGIERITPDWGYQDFWALKQDIFFPFLDGIKARQDRGDLWVTDHISAHQYATERDAATVRTLEATARGIRIELTSTADPKLYDLPLTLITRVPASWKRCRIMQGKNTATATATNSLLRYAATPNAGPIVISSESSI